MVAKNDQIDTMFWGPTCRAGYADRGVKVGLCHEETSLRSCIRVVE